MNLKRHFSYALLFCALGTTAISCKKDKDLDEKPKTEEVIINPKLIRYLSISLGVTPDEIVFDKQKNAFIVRTHEFDLKEITEMYDRANEYKATYEKD